MKILVLAHGDGRRWTTPDGPFLDAPKHFVEFDGETLLARTVRLFNPYGQVVVVGPDDRYQVAGAELVTLDDPDPSRCDMSKFTGTKHLWSTTETTMLVWGDCWYSEQAAALIGSHVGGYHVWRRPGHSTTTGHRWDESFAVAIGPHEHAKVLEKADHVATLVAQRRIKASHIRTHLAAMNKTPLHLIDNVKHAATLRHQTVIDDWTDDIDSPTEWRQWIGRRVQGRYRVGVCVPWCGGDDWRTRSYEWTTRHWAACDLPVYVGDDLTGGLWPNRAAMRNTAAAKAIADGCEVLFFADSDTFVRPDQLWAAAHVAVERNQLVLAYDEYLRIGKTRTIPLMGSREHGNRFEKAARIGASYTSEDHASGAIAIPVSVWEQVGGYDERFVRWGFEDRAFWLAAITLNGTAPRIPGPAYHWWHPPAIDKDRQSSEYRVACDLSARYKHAAAFAPKAGAMLPIDLPADAVPDPEAMRAILAEPGGPLAARLALN